MLNVTLDMNCLIALENKEPAAAHIRQIIDLDKLGEVRVSLLAISGSELKTDKTYSKDFNQFLDRLKRIGLAHLNILKPLGHWDVTFIDWCLIGDDGMIKAEREIHQIMFPDTEFDFSDDCQEKGLDPTDEGVIQKFRNKQCDVISMWSHIHHNGDVFVTNDDHFSKARVKPLLEAYGAGRILSPKEALAYLKQRLGEQEI